MTSCPVCGAARADDSRVCVCGHRFDAERAGDTSSKVGPPPHGTLRALAVLYRIVGVVGLVGGVFRALLLASRERFDGTDVVLALVGGALGFIVFFGLGQAVTVLLEIRDETARLARARERPRSDG